MDFADGVRLNANLGTPDDGGEDLLAHFSEVQGSGFKSLQEGRKVSFEFKQGPRGKQAASIEPLSVFPAANTPVQDNDQADA
ncbi:hypothetical protein VL15_08595 [Burkholderia cepacia]|uniref:CSD domain-containing protein n=1 Tax=Burkholderia cepacia TaxID=292 RepID=A0A0J5XC76_BURCE|nr:hypothetical protein VL15_08595 [Burkholderia cepacia]